jgi:hypothetical protein
VWLHAMLAGFEPPPAHHGPSESAANSGTGADRDEDNGPAGGAAAMMVTGMAVGAGGCARVTGMDATAPPAAMAPPAGTAATTAATGPPAATVATVPPAATAATAFTLAEAPAFAAPATIKTMARAEIADDTFDSTTAEETVLAATVSVEAAAVGVLAATADAEAVVSPAGAPVYPAVLADETGETGAGDSPRLRPRLMSHAPPEFAAEFRAMSEDPRFSSALNDDCDSQSSNFDYFIDVSDMMMRGGDAGWLERAD